MSENFAEADPSKMVTTNGATNPFSETPASQGAADQLRAAAGEPAKETKTTTKSASNPKVTHLKEAAVEKAQHLREVAAEKTKGLTATAGEKAAQLKEAAAERAAHFKESAGENSVQFKGIAGEQWQETRVRAREIHATTEDYVRANPTQSILIAAGVGMLVGLIIRR